MRRPSVSISHSRQEHDINVRYE
ncbi:unnamed protein product, partial [Rotaria magnacalcarata]